jgi:protein SCO1/2
MIRPRPLALTALATFAVALAGTVAFAQLTHGFTALTSETARRDAVAAVPIEVPVLTGIDQAGRRHALFADIEPVRATPRVTIVDFIYTRCVGVCSALDGSYQQLQAAIQARHLEDWVRLVTVSFDPLHDTPATLAQYAQQMHADPRVWTLMSPQHAEQLPGLLASFGIVVVPAPLDQFQHNAAFHVLDAQGRLARIVDLDDPQGALDAALLLVPGSVSPRGALT